MTPALHARQSPSLRPRRHPWALAAAAVCGGLPLGMAWAQGDAAAPVIVSSPPQLLENVTVTATRRSGSVQDLPLNITAVTGAEIQRLGISDLSGLSQVVPGLFLVDQGGRDGNRIVVRGLNVSSLASSEATGNSTGGAVATYLGDIPLYLDLRLNDIDRVEALLGPQGTLYGAGTLGGAIRYLPNKPRIGKTEFSVSQDSFGISRAGGLGSETTVLGNLPLSDQAAVRGSLGYHYSPGYIDYAYLVREPGVSDPEPAFDDPAARDANLRREEDANGEKTLYGRAALLYRFNEQLTGTLSYFYQDQSSEGRSINHRSAIGSGDYESGSRFLEPNDRENQLLSLDLDLDLGFATLTSATGLSKYEELGQRDQTDLLLDFEYGYEDFPAFAAFTREVGEEERLSQEVRLVSSSDRAWNWIIGGFYNRSETDFTSAEFVPGFPEFAGVDRPDNLEYFSSDRQTFSETALFGELGYRFTAAWEATIGARAFQFENDAISGFALPLVDGSAPDEVALVLQENRVSDEDVIFKFNTAYRFNPDLLAYLTISEGYRSGGVNSVPPCLDPLPEEQNVCALPDEVLIQPDKTLNHELGLHSSWLGGRLVINGSVYYIDWKDVQVDGETVNGDVPITVNAAEARSQGLELSVQGLLTRHWRVNANYAYNDSALSRDAPGIVGGGDAFKGDRLPGSPEHQATLFLSYTRPLPNGWIGTAGYGLRAVTDVLTKVGGRENGEELAGYAVHKASASLAGQQWNARLYAENLFDRYVETGVRDDVGAVRAIETEADTDNGDGFKLRRYYKDVLEPLRVGLEFGYQFKL